MYLNRTYMMRFSVLDTKKRAQTGDLGLKLRLGTSRDSKISLQWIKKVTALDPGAPSDRDSIQEACIQKAN